VPEQSRSTIVVWAIAAVLAGLAGLRLAGGCGGADPPPVRIDAGGGMEAPGAPATGAPATGAHDGGPQGAELFVHVAGAVRRPGLMRVPAGSRVAVALERAGGPTRRADLTAVNLAARLQDGQQIVVPAAGHVGRAAAADSAAAAGSAEAPVHLSTATVEQLDGIDGIGPTLAERIIEYRDAHGGFRSIQELGEVEGIGEKRLATLRTALQP
jgi:competence protein ComEA